MQDRMMADISLPQHLFDLHILTVTWLLTYNKTILTLRSYQAHSKFTVNNRGGKSDCLQIRADWNEGLNTAIRDAKDCANFLLGAPLQEREGFTDRLWNYRKISLCSPTDHHETKNNSSYSYFVDFYPRSAIGSTKFDLALWDIDRRKGLVVIQSGQPNNYSNDKDTVKKLVEALYVGYSGLQSAHFHAATRAAREMAHSWRVSG
ncbi:hypothetical protein BDZ94DRAFT_1269435 [Collybia nuda]|uniref:Uncharacterized protein n=1 Tax=Collybia nuda TaxID=64659 RepID=A0A9P6CB00_9AGAR|nr:hypothetical protein BDZ94DRAFT_1269435 [Collybia nuda]